MLAERQANILLAKPSGKKVRRESHVYQNKNKSMKHEKCFNVVSEKTHSSTKYLLPHSEH